MSGGEVFGPAGGGAVDAAPFSVTGPSQVSLDASRSATASFVVSNLTGRPVRARLLPVPGAGAQAGWLRVDGATERELPVAGTTTVDVVVRAADDAPAGAGSFVLGVALEESPDRVVSGPTVAFQVPEAGKKRFPWWIVIVAVAAVLLLVGGGILIWILTRPDTPPDTETTPTSSAPPELASGSLTIPADSALVDFEGGEVWAFGCRFIPESDLCFGDFDVANTGVPGPGPWSASSVTFAGIAVAEDGAYETCVEVLSDPAVPTYVDIPDSASTVHVCFITGDRHYATLEIAPQQEGVAERSVRYTVWEGIA